METDHSHGDQTCVCEWGGGKKLDGWGVWGKRWKLLALEWINYEVLLYNTENYILASVWFRSSVCLDHKEPMLLTVSPLPTVTLGTYWAALCLRWAWPKGANLLLLPCLVCDESSGFVFRIGRKTESDMSLWLPMTMRERDASMGSTGLELWNDGLETQADYLKLCDIWGPKHRAHN